MRRIEIPSADICGAEIPRVLVGNSTFYYGTSYNPVKAVWRRIKFFHFPKNITKLVVKAISWGLTGIQLFAHPKFVDAVEKAEVATDADVHIVATAGTLGFPRTKPYASEIEYAAKLEPELVAPWLIADFLRKKALTERRRREIEEVLGLIRGIGAVPGISTHYPADVIPKIDESGLDVNFYLVPINKMGFYMHPNKQTALEAIRRTKKPVIATKPLAWGRIPPKEAFEFLFEEGVASVAVGVASEKELFETFSAASEVLRSGRSSPIRAYAKHGIP